MRVLITGGAGFIGSWLADDLLRNSHEVLCVDDLSTGYSYWLPKKAHFRLQDVSDTKEIFAIFKDFKPQCVVHAAAKYHSSISVHDQLKTNTIGTYVIASACREFDARMIYCQTALIYGTTPRSRAHDTPVNPVGVYANTKMAGEYLMRITASDAVSVCMANIYGPRNLTGPIPIFYCQIIKGQRSKITGSERSFVYIRDAIKVYRKLIEEQKSPNPTYRRFHLSGKIPDCVETIENVYLAMCKILGATAKMKKLRADADPFPRMIVWPTEAPEHPVTLTDGLKRAVTWYRKHLNPDRYSPKTHLRL